MLRFLYRITGGRPMHLVERSGFTDIVSGRQVHLFRCRLGRTYLAERKWSIFRVGVNPTVDEGW